MSNETKSEKFERMLAVRLPKAVHALSLLQPLASKRDYEYTPAQVQEMVNEIDAVLDSVLERFGVVPEESAEPVPAGATPGPVSGFDKQAIREAYLLIAKKDHKGLGDLRRVILGWSPS